jgi:ribosome maturation factor RimP
MKSELSKLTFFVFKRLMAKNKGDICEQVGAIVQPILDSLQLELVDIEFVRLGKDAVLRLFIDKDGGVTLENCADVSRELSAILDVEEVISVNYSLEVSSPGLDRPLKKIQDYERYAGRLVKIRTYEPFPDDAGNKRKTFLGTLEGLVDGSVRITLKEGQTASIPLERVAKANLEFEF